MIHSLISIKTQTPLGNPIVCPWSAPLQCPKATTPQPFYFPPALSPTLFSRRTCFHFHRENSGWQCKLLQPLTNPQIKLKCNSTPFLSVVDTVCASLNLFRTERLNACSRHPSAALWGLPQLKRPAFPKAMPSFQGSLHPVNDWWGYKGLAPWPQLLASVLPMVSWGLFQTCSADQWLPPSIHSLPWLMNPKVLSNKYPACWSPNQIGFSANSTWNALFSYPNSLLLPKAETLPLYAQVLFSSWAFPRNHIVYCSIISSLFRVTSTFPSLSLPLHLEIWTNNFNKNLLWHRIPF